LKPVTAFGFEESADVLCIPTDFVIGVARVIWPLCQSNDTTLHLSKLPALRVGRAHNRRDRGDAQFEILAHRNLLDTTFKSAEIDAWFGRAPGTPFVEPRA
jgi:hypothetical protein